jgi:hypothetical protein
MIILSSGLNRSRVSIWLAQRMIIIWLDLTYHIGNFYHEHIQVGGIQIADDKSLKSDVLIAQVAGPVIKRVVPRILDAGSVGEDNGTLERLRKGDHPVRETNSRPGQSQRQQGNYPVQTTLPARPGNQPINPDFLIDPFANPPKESPVNPDFLIDPFANPPEESPVNPPSPKPINPDFLINPLGNPTSRVLQTNNSPKEVSFGDKLTRAMQESLTSGALKDGFAEEMKKLLTPENLVMMGGLLAVVGSANLAAAAIGGPIGSAIAAFVQGAIGLAVLGGNAVTLAEASGALFGFVTKAYGAKTDADYLAAAKDFAKFVNVVGPNFISNNMTGAGAAKALGSITGKLASIGGELGKLSPDKQKQIQGALRAGRDMLGKLGKDIQGGFKSVFASINNALSHLSGNNPKKLTGNTASPNSGGKKPKKDQNQPKPTRWTKATENIEKSLQQKIDKGSRKDKAGQEKQGLITSLPELQAKKVNPEMVAKLTENGLFPGELNALLNQARNPQGLAKGLDRIKKPEFDELMELANNFLVRASKQPNKLALDQAILDVKELIKYVISDTQVYKFVKEVVNSGKLTNVEGINKAVKNFATEADRSKALGHQFEVEFAAELVRSGKKVTMGKGADVVDEASKQAWQLKNVDGEKAFSRLLKEAAEQLTGGKGEKVLPGYLKGIKLRITGKDSPEYLQSHTQLEESIKKVIGRNVKDKDKGKSNDKWNSVDQVQITIGNETHIFDIKKSREGIIFPSYRKTEKLPPPSISELPTETRVAGLQNGSPQLLSAIEKYQQTVKNAPTSEQRKERQVNYQVAMAKQSEDVYRRLDQVNQNIQRLNTELAGQTFNLNEISPNILRNASSNDQKAVAYASALLLKNSGQQAFVLRDSELELVKINDTGQVTLYDHRLSTDAAQNILDAAQQLQQERTMQAQRSNSNQREM